MESDFDPNMEAGTATFSDGSTHEVTAGEIVDRIVSGIDDIYSSGVLSVTPLGGGLARLDIDLLAGRIGESYRFGNEIPLADFPDEGAALRSDLPYFVLFRDGENPQDAQLWTCRSGALLATRDEWSVCSVQLSMVSEDGTDVRPMTSDAGYFFVEQAEDGTETERTLADAGLDLDGIVAFYNDEADRFITFFDLLAGVAMQRAAISAAVEAHERGKAAPMPQLEAIKPIQHYVPIAKTTHVLTEPSLFAPGGALLDVGRKAGQMTIDFGLSWTNGEPPADISTTKPIDREDVRVIAGIVTLKLAGNTTISPRQIAETMGYQNPTSEQQMEIHRRVMKLRAVDGHIDWTEQARRYKIVNPDTGLPYTRAEFTGALISANVFEGEDEDGNHFIRYQLLSDPITYQHAHMLQQVVRYPQHLLELRPIDQDGKRRKRVTSDQTSLMDSVLQYVHSVKNRKGMGPTIRYDTLFEWADIDTSTSKRRATAVTFTNDFLRALVAEGVIDGFSVDAPGRSHKPISVTVYVKVQRKRKI